MNEKISLNINNKKTIEVDKGIRVLDIVNSCSFLIDNPSIKISPSSKSCIPTIDLINVVLPQLLEPDIVVI